MNALVFPGARRKILPPGTIVGGFRVIDVHGWDIARRTLYLAECLCCGEKAPRVLKNLAHCPCCRKCSNKRRCHEPRRLRPGTVVGGFRIVAYHGRDDAYQTRYIAACLKCGAQEPRTTSNMKKSSGCNACAQRQRNRNHDRRDYRALVATDPRAYSIPPVTWPKWRIRCEAVRAELTEPLTAPAMLSLIRRVAAKRHEGFAARQWLAAGEELGLWRWERGRWIRSEKVEGVVRCWGKDCGLSDSGRRIDGI